MLRTKFRHNRPTDSRKKKNDFIGLDSYILNSFSYLSPIWVYVSHCMTSSLKFEITVYYYGFHCHFIQVTEQD